MSYNYTQLHQIIEMQYKVNYDESNKNLWFLNQSAKLLKGYINPSSYLNTIMSGNEKPSIKEEDPPLYLDN